MEDNGAFWELIAQVIPVVGLALVLEARTMAGRFAKPAPRVTRDEAARWGVAFFVAAVLSAVVFFIALLLSASALPLQALADAFFLQALAILVATYGLILVVFLPVTLFFRGTTSAALLRFACRFPWSRARRSLRKYDHLVEQVNQQMRKNRSHRLEERTAQTGTLIRQLRHQQPDLPFDPRIACVMHHEAPCVTRAEHHAKTIEFWSRLVETNQGTLEALGTSRVSILRFMVTGTSVVRIAAMTKKLDTLRGIAEVDARIAARGLA